MKYILDTDTIIYFLKGQPIVVEHLAKINPKEITTTIINQTELLFGTFNSTKKKQNLERIESFLEKIHIAPFCKAASYIFAEKKALLKKKGPIVADLDLMIASIALCHQSILVTNNVKHFAKISSLEIENWSI